MKRPINKGMVASAICTVSAMICFVAAGNWILVGVAVAIILGSLAYAWVDQGTLKDLFRM